MVAHGPPPTALLDHKVQEERGDDEGDGGSCHLQGGCKTRLPRHAALRDDRDGAGQTRAAGTCMIKQFVLQHVVPKTCVSKVTKLKYLELMVTLAQFSYNILSKARVDKIN